MCRKPTLSVVVLISSLFLFIISSFSQDLDDVSISGRVVDPNGDLIAGATVSITLVSTGVVRITVTKDDGLYRITELSPGFYRVKASANGFGDRETTNLNLISGQAHVCRCFENNINKKVPRISAIK